MVIKKIVPGALLLIVTVIGVKAFTYSRLSEKEKVKRITEKMAKNLTLTQEQEMKVYQINLSRAAGHAAAYQQGRNKKVILTAVTKWRTDLKQVLNPEQARKLKI